MSEIRRAADIGLFNERPPVFTLSEQLGRLGRNWGWLLAGGIGYLMIGFLALTWPVTSTVSLTFSVGALFALSGILSLIQAFRLWNETGTGWRIFHATIALAAGALTLRFPAGGMIGIAIAMTFYFFASATTKGVIAFGMRPNKGWGWMLFGAISSFILGVYMISTFPASALWVPGVVLGVDFVVYGFSLIGFSFSLKLARDVLRERGFDEGEGTSRRIDRAA